jgi:hypothetical protein
MSKPIWPCRKKETEENRITRWRRFTKIDAFYRVEYILY